MKMEKRPEIHSRLRMAVNQHPDLKAKTISQRGLSGKSANSSKYIVSSEANWAQVRQLTEGINPVAADVESAQS